MSIAARQFHFDSLDSDTVLETAPSFGQMREESPVYWSASLEGWVIGRHEDVLDCLKDSRLLVPREDARGVRLEGLAPEVAAAFRALFAEHPCEGREALALRVQAAPGFTPQVLDTWRPAIRELVTRLVRRGAQERRMDAVRAVCAPLPALVLAELFGLPAPTRELFLSATRHLAELHRASTRRDAPAREALAATRAWLDALCSLLEARRLAPGADLLSRMLQVQQPGPRTATQRVSAVVLGLTCGLASAADQLGNGLHALLDRPGQPQPLPLERARLRPAVDECLRLAPALPLMRRVVTETCSVRGRILRKDETVYLCVAAANRDPRVFTAPESFEPTRDAQRQKHLTLGLGVHQRLDAALLRHELELLLEVLGTELPGLRLDEGHASQPRDGEAMTRGFDSLPVGW